MKHKFQFMALAAIVASMPFVACSDDDDDDPDASASSTSNAVDEGPTEATFSIPTYDDDYSSISAWSNYKSWNLANVHDPSVAFYNGYYYMFGTDASYGNAHEGHGHFQGKRSTDLVNWEWVPGIFYDRTRPSWIAEKINEYRAELGLDAIAEDDMVLGYWAPVVRVVDGKLRMYYSVVCDNLIGTGGTTFDGTWTERAVIGCCESTDPANGKWTDIGFVTTSSSDKLQSDGTVDYSRASESDYDAFNYYNAIDPTYVITDDGEHWLIHGSWHSGFTALQINPSTGLPYTDLGLPWATSPEGLAENGYGTRIATRSKNSRWQGSEGPEIIYHDGYYYLFMAYDGLDVPYNTRVARSTSITGPYVDILGTDITNNGGECYPIVTHPYKFLNHSGWVGISHCGIFKRGNDASDEWFYMSQGRLPANYGGNAYSNAIMMGHVRRLVWAPASASDLTNVWPIALPERYAGVPDRGTITSDSIVGKWEHINLAYSYGNQQQSFYVTFNADGTYTAEDGTIGGNAEGTWSYDSSTKYLTIDNAAVVCVEREVDWEASPRCVTLVYAGIGSDQKVTWWGKKVE